MFTDFATLHLLFFSTNLDIKRENNILQNLKCLCFTLQKLQAHIGYTGFLGQRYIFVAQ